MALDDYRAKRRLAETPEPGARLASSPQGNLFVIHKHAARRLHYDLRLELDGVLKSWAVPKGPSLDPDDKHLAVHVEDHPLDYADFEGVIPEGQYGGGTVMVWDRGHWYPEEATADDPRASYEAGHLKFRLEGEKLRGRWMLVRMKPRHDPEGKASDDDADNWLFFKERDDEARRGDEAAVVRRLPDSVASGRSVDEIAAAADRVWQTESADAGARAVPVAQGGGPATQGGGPATQGGGPATQGGGPARPRVEPAAIPGARRAALPGWTEPELATLVAAAPGGDAWLHEIKFDGYRVVCRLAGGKARLFTRRGADWTTHFPTLLDELRALPVESALLDGEVVYVHDDGRTTFTALASALQSGSDPRGRIVYYVFDLLHLDGFDLRGAPLVARKEALERLLGGRPAGARVRYVEHVTGQGEQFFRQACDLELEGVVAKRAGSTYRSGRSRDWLKVKCLRRQEFLVTGFTERTGVADRIGALLVGFHERPGGPIVCAGRVGTGWDDKAMLDLRGRLDPLVVEGPPCANAPRGKAAAGVRWVRPELVVEIEFFDWNGRDALRHSSFEGVRLDKPAAEVVFETAAADVAPAAPAPSESGGGDPPAGGGTGGKGSRSRSAKSGAAKADKRSSGEADKRSSGEADKRSSGEADKRTSGEADKRTSAKADKRSSAKADKRSSGTAARRPAATGAARRKDEPVVVAGVAISHPDRVVYPDVGITKLDVARYYELVAPLLLPHIARRPLTLVRCPGGLSGQCFFQKHGVEQFPKSVTPVPIRESDGTATYPAVESLEGVLALVQMSALELHVWGSRIETLELPDQMVFDLDPDDGLPFAQTIAAAQTLRLLLEHLGLVSFVKTSGGKGLHVVVPLRPTRSWDEVKNFSRAVTEVMVRAQPELYLATMSRAKRAGKVFIDFLRNGRGATFVAPYSTRRRAGAPVSAPLRWDELTARLRPDGHTITTMRRRLAGAKTDPWQGYDDARQEITAEMMRTLGLEPGRTTSAA